MWPRICTTQEEKPHWGVSGVPFMNRTILLLVTTSLICAWRSAASSSAWETLRWGLNCGKGMVEQIKKSFPDAEKGHVDHEYVQHHRTRERQRSVSQNWGSCWERREGCCEREWRKSEQRQHGKKHEEHGTTFLSLYMKEDVVTGKLLSSEAYNSSTNTPPDTKRSHPPKDRCSREKQYRAVI